MKLSDQYALWAVTICALGAIEFAAHTRPRLATALRFFALSWAVLLPFYALQPYLGPENLKTLPLLGISAEFLPTYAGIVLLLAVEPLLREAVHHGVVMDRALQVVDFISGRSLYLIAVPHAVFAAGGSHHGMFMRWIDFFLAGAGFFLLAIVLNKLVHGAWQRLLWCMYLIVALVYSGSQLTWALRFNADDFQMSDDFKILFAICKVALSATLIPLIMKIPPPQPRLQVWYERKKPDVDVPDRYLIGELWYRDDKYVFRYLKAFSASKLSPLPGFSNVKSEYVSNNLFQFFEEHLTNRPEVMQQLLTTARVQIDLYEIRLIH